MKKLTAKTIARIAVLANENIKSANKALKIYEKELRRLKRIDSSENYDLVYQEYKEAMIAIKDKASKLMEYINTYEQEANKMPFSLEKTKVLSKIKRMKETLNEQLQKQLI